MPKLESPSIRELPRESRRAIHTRAIDGLLGDMLATSAIVPGLISPSIRAKNLFSVWGAASMVSWNILSLKRISLALIPEIYWLRIGRPK